MKQIHLKIWFSIKSHKNKEDNAFDRVAITERNTGTTCLNISAKHIFSIGKIWKHSPKYVWKSSLLLF